MLVEIVFVGHRTQEKLMRTTSSNLSKRLS